MLFLKNILFTLFIIKKENEIETALSRLNSLIIVHLTVANLNVQ